MRNYEAYAEHIHKHLRLRNTELAIQLAHLEGFTAGLLRNYDISNGNSIEYREETEHDDHEYTNNSKNGDNGIEEGKDS